VTITTPALRRESGKTPKLALSLRVLSGIHTGAEFRLPARGILMIGRADDCDLILSDSDIAAHHCVITVVGEQIMVRAMEAAVETHDGAITPGEHAVLDHFALARLGEVEFAVGPHWSERWQMLADSSAAGVTTMTPRQRAARRHGVLLVSALLLAVAGMVLFGGWRQYHRPDAPRRNLTQMRDEARKVVDAQALRNVAVSTDAEGHVVLRGVVGSDAQVARLQQQLRSMGLITDFNVRAWPGVARQVGDIFQMHGFTVESSLQSLGEVQVGGHFGTRKQAADDAWGAVLASSDMQSLNTNALGLRLGMRNFDEGKEPPKALDPGKRIRRVVGPPDAYVVTADGSRFYPNAQLPQGGTFLGVDEKGNVLVRLGNQTRQLTRDDEWTTPHDMVADYVLPARDEHPAVSASAAVAAATAAMHLAPAAVAPGVVNPSPTTVGANAPGQVAKASPAASSRR